MKRSNVDTSTPSTSSKRGKHAGTNYGGSSPPLLRYENYEQFKLLMDKSDFEEKLDHPSNEDIIHRIVTETRNASKEDIDGRKKVLDKIITKRRALLHNQVYNECHTPLHRPNVNIQLLKELIELGAPINAVTQPLQLTFLHTGAVYLNPDEFHDLLAYLLKMGFNKLIQAKDCNGLTPLHLAVYYMNVKEETILLCLNSEDSQLDLNNTLAHAIIAGRDERFLKVLQKLGASPVKNPLPFAAESGNLDAINLFASVDNLNLRGPDGNTTLLHALLKGRRNIHEVVLDLTERCKYSVLIPNAFGQLPLSVALEGLSKGRIGPQTVEVLRSYTAEVTQGFEEIMKSRMGNNVNCRAVVPFPVDDNSNSSTSGNCGNPAKDAKSDTRDCLNDGVGTTGLPNCSKLPSHAETSSEHFGKKELRPKNTLVHPKNKGNVKSTFSKNNFPNTTGARTYTNEAIHNLVADSLGLSREEVELRKNQITTILQSRPELLNTKVYERTFLLCEKVHLELLKFLLAKGADVSATTKKKKETVLHLAARYLSPDQYHELVIIVLEKNLKVPKTLNSLGQLALHIACYNMEVRKKTLIAVKESEVDLKQVDGLGENLLSHAVNGGRSVQFLRILSSFGLQPVKNKLGESLAHYAARHCSPEVLKYVIELSPADVNALNNSNQSPLHCALSGDLITEDHVKITHSLLHEYGVKDRLKEPHMRDVIHCVAAKSAKCSPEEIERRKEVIDLLVECDATLINAEVGEERATSLERPMVHAKLLKYLIRKGWDPRHRDVDQCTFLHLVQKMQFSPEEYHELILSLVKNGYADVLQMKDRIGSTPLHESVRNLEVKEETFELFKPHGGLNQVDRLGHNIVSLAALEGRSLRFMKMLVEKGGMGGSTMS